MSLSMRCPKCGGPMEEGFLRDSVPGAPVQAKRAERQAPRSFWTGVVPKGREEYPVISYRCGGCGFLESYARPEAPEE
jgi:hypothetical protein